MEKKLNILFLTIALLSFIACQNEVKEAHVEEAPTVQVKDSVKKKVEKLTDNRGRHHHIHNIDTTDLDNDSILIDSLTVATDSMRLRILAVGNSYSRDAYSYVPYILSELVPGLNLDFTIMYYPGRPLKDQWRAYQSGKAEYQRDTYTTEQGVWHTEKNMALKAELDSLREWDLVMFQQASGSSPMYETYQPALNNLISTTRSLLPNAKIGWLLTPAHPDGYSKMPAATSTDMWQLICDAVGMLMSDEDMDLIIPGGTAIQNARQTYLDSLGIFGHMTADGLHLQDGIPCLIEAMTVAQSIINFYNIRTSISHCTLRPTQQWAEERNIPEMNGNVIEGTDDDYRLCKRIALTAVSNPYTLRTIFKLKVED